MSKVFNKIINGDCLNELKKICQVSLLELDENYNQLIHHDQLVVLFRLIFKKNEGNLS